jgi:hypothetical protein
MPMPKRVTPDQRRAYKSRKSLEYYYRDHEENQEAARLRMRRRRGPPQPKPRLQAKARGETRYNTGKPCAKGHLAERLVSNGRCIQCMYDWRRAWFAENPEKQQAAIRRKNETVNADPRQKLMRALRIRVYRAIKGGVKSGSAVKALGCSIDHFKTHIENLWQPGMSWDNWSCTGWHLDHIKPLYQFDLSDPIQFAAACHYLNYQPLWAEDNLRKNRYQLKG